MNVPHSTHRPTAPPAGAPPGPAVFLDRDGTIIEDKDYLQSPDQVCFFPGAVQSLQQLKAAHLKLIMVTNQSGIGRGYFTTGDLEQVHRYIQDALHASQAGFDAIYVAPEAPSQPSYGRKPSPNFLFDAAREFHVDLGRSWMVGDKLSDLQAGWAAGVGGVILVRTGKGRETERSLQTHPPLSIVDHFSDAARLILMQLTASADP